MVVTLLTGNLEIKGIFYHDLNLNLIVFLTHLSINESLTFCLLIFAGAEEEVE